MKTVRLEATVPLRILVDWLGDAMDSDDLFALIVDLDANAGRWDFTLRLAEHFARLKLEHAIEEAADHADR